MRDHTAQEFRNNLARVRNLTDVYKSLSIPRVKGRVSVKKTDVLRAAVVFLHGSVEEVFRNLLLWKLPAVGNEEALNAVPLIGGRPSGRAEKFLLGRLTEFRGRFVENLIYESVEAYVNFMNLNNKGDIESYLRMVGLEPTQFSMHYDAMQSLFQRRHQIVHQADRNSSYGSGQHKAESLALVKVEMWIDVTEAFIGEVIAATPDNPDDLPGLLPSGRSR